MGRPRRKRAGCRQEGAGARVRPLHAAASCLARWWPRPRRAPAGSTARCSALLWTPLAPGWPFFLGEETGGAPSSWAPLSGSSWKLQGMRTRYHLSPLGGQTPVLTVHTQARTLRQCQGTLGSRPRPALPEHRCPSPDRCPGGDSCAPWHQGRDSARCGGGGRPGALHCWGRGLEQVLLFTSIL